MENFGKKAGRALVSAVLSLALAFGLVPFAGFDGGGLLGPNPVPQANAAGDGAWNGTNYDVSWYGDGTSDVYTISDADDLAGLAKIVNNYTNAAYSATGNQYVAEGQRAANVAEYGKKEGYNDVPSDDFYGKKIILTSDIDLGGTTTAAYSLDVFSPAAYEGPQWEEIGRSAGTHGNPGGWAFNGVFDGNYHTVKGLISKNEAAGSDSDDVENYKGIFGNLGSMGLVKNIIVDKGYVSGDRGVGSIVGRSWGTVQNCANLGVTVKSNGQRGPGGGIAGQIYNNGAVFGTLISGCLNKAPIKNWDSSLSSSRGGPGGIVGEAERPVYNSYNAGYVETVANAGIKNGSVIGSKSGSGEAGYILNLFGVTSSAANLNNLLGYGSCSNPATSNSALKTLDEMKGTEVLAALNSNVLPSFPAITSTDTTATALLAAERVAPSFAAVSGDVPKIDDSRKLKFYFVTFSAVSAEAISGTQGWLVSYGSVIGKSGNLTYELPVATRAGYNFNGWWTTNAATGGAMVTTSTALANEFDTTYYARWTARTFPANFVTNGATAISPASMALTYDSKIGAMPTITKIGYNFMGWFTTNGSIDQYRVSTEAIFQGLTSPTYYAIWSAKQFTVTLNANGGKVSGRSSAAVAVTYGRTYNLPTPVKTYYKFVGWFTAAGRKIVNGTTVNITANMTLTARWTDQRKTASVKWPKAKISGKKKVGKTVKVVLSGAKYTGLKVSKTTYQWYANGKKINKATKKTFKPTGKQKGKKLTVKVTITVKVNAGYKYSGKAKNTVSSAKFGPIKKS